LLPVYQENANTPRFLFSLPDRVSERSVMPAIIPLIAAMVFFITILLHMIYYIIQNEGLVLAAIVLSAIVVIDIPSLAIILHDAIVDQNTSDSYRLDMLFLLFARIHKDFLNIGNHVTSRQRHTP
jgi:hypothetical protein